MLKDKLFPATLMPDSDWWHALWPDPKGTLESIGITADMTVVDLCCGDGHFTKPLCELVHPGKAWAVDLDAELLTTAHKACLGHENFHAIHGDAREIASQIEQPVDTIFIANTFHGIPDKSEFCRAVFHALKKGGRFAIINWYRRPREETTVLDQPRGPDTELRMQPEDVQKVVQPAGFKLEKIVDVGPYHYAIIFVKP